MDEIILTKNDELVMKLLHYFITEKGYSPIVLHGAKDEIWLENLDGNYQIVRIVSNYIHNNEQLDFDIFRTSEIVKKIKRKTFSFGLNTLSIFVNLGDNVALENVYAENIDLAGVKKVEDIKKYKFILEVFPDITKDTNFKEHGLELFSKISKDIADKNEHDYVQNEEVFKPKKTILTYIIIAINVLICILGRFNIEIIDKLYLPAHLNHDYYRLITAAFTHYDFLHLACNMYALYIIGRQIENFFGKAKFPVIYLFSAITSSLLSLSFGGNSLGASGAIFGLFGALLIFGYHYRLYLGNVMRSQVIPLILANLAIGLLIPGIDLAAHLGGLIGGALISMGLGVKYKSHKDEKINGLILSTVLLAFLIYTAFI